MFTNTNELQRSLCPMPYRILKKMMKMKCDPCGNIFEYKNQSKSHIVKEHPKVWWMLKHVKVKGRIENTVRMRIEASPDWVWMEDSESCRRRWLSASVDSNWSRVDSRRPESRMLSAELGASLKRYITFHLKTGYIQNIFLPGLFLAPPSSHFGHKLLQICTRVRSRRWQEVDECLSCCSCTRTVTMCVINW